MWPENKTYLRYSGPGFAYGYAAVRPFLLGGPKVTISLGAIMDKQEGASHLELVGLAKGYLTRVQALLSQVNCEAVAEFVSALLEARERGAQIFFLGNGGSAATASHFANDIAIGTRTLEKPFRAFSLTDNVAVMTAIANDYSYEQVFVQQLKVALRPGDIVVGISASGNSPNVVKAIDFANQKGAFTVGLTGFEGGKVRQMVSLSLHIPTAKGEYGPVEDVHMVLDHLIGTCLSLMVKREREESTELELGTLLNSSGADSEETRV